MDLTRHGGKRVARRTGVGKRASQKLGDLALLEGLPRDGAKGNLRRFLDKAFFSHHAAYITVYHGAVYVFGSKEGPLITTYPLPGNLMHKKAARVA